MGDGDEATVTDTLRDALQTTLGTAYTLERELGGGGMSRVFVADDNGLRRKVVVKVLSPELAAGISAERFEREIELAASLQQANIVSVLSTGHLDNGSAGANGGLPYYTMPFVDGLSLRARLARGATPVAEAVSVLRDVARALAYAHERRVIHRDIKPENVLLSGGTAMVTDFGIAKAISAARGDSPADRPEPTLTSIGMSLGTPAYMAPEQAAGGAVDHRADIYSWGVVAYELLAGRHPFAERTTPQQLIAAHIAEAPTPLRRVAPGVGPALDALVMRCLEKDPAQRPGAATELVDVLSAPNANATRSTRGVAVRVAVATAAVVALAAAGAVAWRDRSGVRSSVPAPESRMLAVLPFANLGGDSTQQYFADGLADELTTALGRIPKLQVASRSAAFAPAVRVLDAAAAGRRLGASSVIEGAVRRAGSRIRLSVHLVNVQNGVVLWSDEFEHDGADVFAAQDDLTRRVATALHDRLKLAESPATSLDRGTSDAAAYDLYLQGRYLFARRGEGNLRRAATLLTQAIARDTAFARAIAALAMVQVVLPEYAQASTGPRGADGRPARDTVLGAGLRSAARAIALDSTIADAHLALGYGLISRWDWDASETSFRRALALEPSNPDAHHWHGDLLFARGALPAGLDELRRALELEPTSAIVVSEMSDNLYLQRRFAESIAAGHRATQMDSLLAFAYFNYSQPFLFLGQPDSALAVLAKADRLVGEGQLLLVDAVRAAALAAAGRRDEARRQVAIVEAAAERGGVPFYAAAIANAGVGDREAGLRWLTRSVDAHEAAPAMYGVVCDPMFDVLKDDARFDGLMRRMGIQACPARVRP